MNGKILLPFFNPPVPPFPKCLKWSVEARSDCAKDSSKELPRSSVFTNETAG